jgi:hypothetical protein
MVHDVRPALAAAIRSEANRRGALAAVLGGIPMVAAGVMQADAARSQRHGKRAAQSEGKKKKRAKPGPPGPQGLQGARGPAGPKAITSPLAVRARSCNASATTGSQGCLASCGQNEIAVSGGFRIPSNGALTLHQSEMVGNGWEVQVVNNAGGTESYTALVYCLPV